MQPRLTDYATIRRGELIEYWQKSEIPVEHFISLPVPTQRLGEPGYAFFSGASVRRMPDPVRQEPPDRWWVVSAETGKLAWYALTRFAPLAAGTTWQTVTLSPTQLTIAELRDSYDQLDRIMTSVAEAFFEHRHATVPEMNAARTLLIQVINPALTPFYHALAPDFFRWLGEME